jgi:hypothetical protein
MKIAHIKSLLLYMLDLPTNIDFVGERNLIIENIKSLIAKENIYQEMENIFCYLFDNCKVSIV